MGGRADRPMRLLLVFGAFSFALIGLGAWVCAESGVPTGSWVRNLIAWAVGAVLATGLAFVAGRGASLSVALLAAPVGLAVTFLNPDQQGVHRWIDVGPVHANAAMLLLPSAVVALGGLAGGRRWPWLATGAAMILLALQPDASQALALGCAAGLIAMLAVRPLGLRLAILVALAALAALAWFRPDPLGSVAEVEELVDLAFKFSPLAGTGVLILLAATAAAPAVAVRSNASSLTAASLGLCACLLIWAVAPWLGAFPVPFAGIGMSPIVGAWLGVGLLAGMVGTRPVGRFGD